ncbi:MAG: Phosphoglyceromutase [uncultured Gemmatimonadetes bacterium]|uniref:Phosphoglyceromutase n=1 Tax=uncultured Gemmatimonadota bacterium TaxID=203437 RepID=A0A6J4KWK8_9BACT|nr:MAG: Phosphoglyceromutase [uncultured Gemmatimonadota bacterium]
MPAEPHRALLVFLDGVGIGPADPEANPFAAAHLPRIRELLGGRLPVAEALDGGPVVAERAVLVAADATLGIDGIPQSGTGQTTLLTGRNAAALYGRHFGPWVPTGLREMLAAENLLARARAGGLVAAFANAYPVALIEADPRIFRRPAAPPLAARAAGVLTRDVPQLAAGEAVASSITNHRWRERTAEVPAVTAEQAGRNLAAIAAAAHVTLFAHYDTDHAGHRGGMEGAVAALERVDAFLGGLAGALAPDTLLVVSSDHGNVEDVREGHTLNPVPVLALGPGREALAERIRSIADVTPAILALLGIEPTTP